MNCAVKNDLSLVLISVLLVFGACKKDTPDPTPPNNNNDPQSEVPEVTTAPVANVMGSTAFSGGEVTDAGSAVVTARGVCYSTEPEPTIADFTTEDGTGEGAFTSQMTDLEEETEYFVRAYATSSAGTAYGEELSFTTITNTGSGEVIAVNSNISTYTTWTNDFIWQLEGRITILDGATLEIESGTVIKAEAGSGTNAKCLLVAKGGTILAEGNENAPIIFTSVLDDITPTDVQSGNFSSPNLQPSMNGLWGGVIVLGNAKISASDGMGDLSELQIEGIPTSDPNGLYGGNNNADNSGVLKYISIRHGGTSIGPGNEINGLTLGGVGSETTIENIEIVANQDDGVEWFGGTVNVTNVVSWNCGDDGLDSDQAWGGNCDNFVIVGAGGHCLELDGPEGSLEAGHAFSNGSIKASYQAVSSVDLINVDDNSIVSLENLYFTGIVADQEINSVTATGVSFSEIYLDVPQGELGNHVNGAVPPGIVAGGSPQADVTVFGWTWASQAGALSGL